MTPSRPYIMRALYEWIVDNDCTPYVLVDANVTDVMVPQQFVKDGQIVLNISPGADGPQYWQRCHDLQRALWWRGN